MTPLLDAVPVVGSSESLIAILQAVHTGAWLAGWACVIHVVRCGIAGRRSRGLAAAIAIPSLIGALWWLNGRECVLSSMIYALAGGDRTRADTLLPAWLARWSMPAASVAFLFGCALLLWRQRSHRWRS